MDLDILLWANIYQSTGEKIHYTKDEQPYPIYPLDGDIYIGAYNKKPTYDFGASLSWNGLKVLFNSRFSKMQSPYSMSALFTPYSYDKYVKIDGNRPGYAVGSTQGEISYAKNWNNFNVKIAATIDHENQQRYQILGDTVPDFGFNEIIPNGTNDTLLALNGFFQNHLWQSNTIGANLQGAYQYQLGQQEGYVLLGGHFYKTTLSDSHYLEGDEFTRVLREFDESKNLALGSEWNTDAYLQVKHKWSESFILNAGLRYDMKRRNDDRTINVFSPRIALIYSLNHWNFKVSYAKSFVDAPYYYRNSTLDIRGSGDLEPEYMDSWQLSCTNSKLLEGLNFDFNVYYNYARDFVYNDQIVGRYINAGFLKSVGSDLMLQYTYKRLLATGNLSWQHVLSSDMYPVNGNNIFSVPRFQSNIVLGYRLTDALSMHVNTLFTSKQISQAIVPAIELEYRDVDIPSRAIFNVGAKYELKPLTLELEVYNLFNQKYYQAGNSNAPIRQQGLWFMFNAGIKL
jgi:iron complex outermembrane receptor protein